MTDTATTTAPSRHRARIKRLGPQHETDLLALFLDLDRPCRVSRFAYAASDHFLIQYSQRALSSATWIAGAFVDETLRGVVEAYDVAAGAVEAAFLVERDWRRRGLGTALLQAAMQWARENDRPTLRMMFSRSNWPMRKLASNAQARLDLSLDEISAHVAISAQRFEMKCLCNEQGVTRERIFSRAPSFE
jgi:GNAT superfamily N-acetyltransferase